MYRFGEIPSAASVQETANFMRGLCTKSGSERESTLDGTLYALISSIDLLRTFFLNRKTVQSAAKGSLKIFWGFSKHSLSIRRPLPSCRRIAI